VHILEQQSDWRLAEEGSALRIYADRIFRAVLKSSGRVGGRTADGTETTPGPP
jgi:hypothetical protein